MPLIMLDTNILVYVHDQNAPQKQERARQVISGLKADIVRIGAQNLAEFVNVVIKKLRPPLTAAQAYEEALLFAQSWPVFDLTPQIVLEAARGVRDHQLSYYDAQIWAAARLNQVTVIFSEDFQDGQTLDGVRFVNPFTNGFEIEKWV